MASLLTVRLDKGAAPSLGFRLQGGKDFGTPLVIQKVNGGSPAERSGLVAGDSVIKINNTDVFNLRHKDAQDVIVRAGPSFEVTIQRGGSTWKPSVIPTGPVHAASPVSPVTKTSLAASRQESIGAIGTGHNVSAKPFGPQVNGTVNGGPPRPPVNNQYNSPIKLYSDQSIAETLSAQTEVLSTGALGVNFKKNEKNYDATNSAVYRMLQEAEKEPRSETEPDAGVVTASLPGVQGLRHVIAPETKAPSSAPQLPPGQNICANCERLIVGVFVRIKDKNLHVECFKCATCGTSLKNVGYYNLNNKLYCDVHAKLAAISQASGGNLAPVTVPPGGRAPANAISSALSSHSFPSPSPLSPRTNLAQPFQPLDDQGANLSLQSLNLTDNKQNNSQINSTPLSFGNYLNKTGNYSPKSFSSVNAPSYNTLPKASPLSPIHSGPAPSYSPASSGRSVQSFVWPPPPEEPEAPTACPIYVPPQSHLHVKVKPEPEMDMAQFQAPKLSLCSEEVSTITNRSAFECVETISETLETQRLIEDVLRNRPPSPPPPEATPRHSLAEAPPPEELKRLTEFTPNTVECKLKSQVENSVPQKWESPLVQALRIDPDPFKQIPKKSSRGSLATALAIAPSEPFLPQVPLDRKFSLPEETEPYFPPEHQIEIEVKEPKPPKPDSQLVKALQTAPERPFTPVGVPPSKKKDPLEEFFKELPKPQQRLSMRDALTTASDRPYSPLITESVGVVKEKREDLEKPLKPPSFQKPKIQDPQAPKPFPVKFQIEEKDSRKTMEKQQTETVEEIIPEEQQGVLPIFTGFSCSFENKSEHSQFKVEISTTPPVPTGRTTPGVKVTRTGASSESVQEESRQTIIEKQAEEVVQKRPLPLAAALHKPGLLPQYQKNLSENAEAELRMMEKMEAAKIRMEKVRPVIKVEDGDLNLPGKSFIPVPEDRPPSSSFSPRPRPLTPSMINKPAPALPYYQASLVAQECRAAGVNLLDPTSPAISRSPSPCPGGERPASPYRPNPPPRPKSPAQGPPPNPLTCGRPLPTPRDSRVEVAKKNLSSYIPQHRSKMELREDKRAEFEDRRIEDESRCEVRQEGDFSVAVAERSHLDHLEQMKKSQSLSVEEGGGVQMQRKKTVTEEFERTQKMVEIERSIVKNYPFKGSRDPVMVEGQGIVGLHVTNPQPIESPFLKNKSIAQPCQPQQIKHVPSPSSMAPLRHVPAPSGSAKPSQSVNKSNIPLPNAGSGGGRQAGAIGVAPKRGRGILNTSALTGSRIPLCGSCHSQIRGPFITALGKIWCPDHFVCATPQCRRPLQDLGFVEEHGQLYCEYCFEQYLAPPCSKCNAKIKGDCLKAIGKNYHPECFNCVYCGKLFSNSPFFLEDGSPYCEADWNELFTTKCFACGFPVEAGDRWVEALNNNYHSQCFNCTMCKKNLEGQSFFAKGGRPFCKNHAR